MLSDWAISRPIERAIQMKSNSVDTLFSTHRAAIAALRSRDAVFDEICRDYQLLSEEYFSSETKPGSKPSQFARDIRETLNGLADEILQSLQRSGKI